MPRKAVTHGACPSSFECCVAVAGRVATVDDGSTLVISLQAAIPNTVSVIGFSNAVQLTFTPNPNP